MDAFKTSENKLKAVTSLLGVFTLGFTAYSYVRSNDGERYALAIVIIAFLFSLALVIFSVLKLLPTSALFRKIEMVTHLVLAVLLAVGWIVFVSKTVEYAKSFDDKHKICRIVALLFGLPNIIIYAFISFKLYTIFKKG